MDQMFHISKNWEDMNDVEKIEGLVSDLIADFLYYDRKDDDHFRPGDIDRIVKAGLISVDRIVEVFRSELVKGLE